MNIKDKIKQKSFWVSLISGGVILLRCFGVGFSQPEVDAVVSAVCALLLALGIISGKSSSSDKTDVESGMQTEAVPQEEPKDDQK